MSANPRYITAAPGVTVSWDNATWFFPRGMAIDCAPGSALESAIGAVNLSAVIPLSDPRRAEGGGGGTFSKDGLAN